MGNTNDTRIIHDQPATQPASDQPEGRRSIASWLVPTQLVPGGQQRPSWYQPSWCSYSLQTSALEWCGWRVGLEIFRPKKTGGTSWVGTSWVGLHLLAAASWVPAESMLPFPLAARMLAGFIHFSIDNLLSWFKGFGTERARQTLLEKSQKSCIFSKKR